LIRRKREDVWFETLELGSVMSEIRGCNLSFAEALLVLLAYDYETREEGLSSGFQRVPSQRLRISVDHKIPAREQIVFGTPL